jgi:hypothetical protein
MHIINGKDPDYFAVWSCDTQCYTVYYKNREIAKGYKLSDIKSYLN